jgi:hypothetical protein
MAMLSWSSWAAQRSLADSRDCRFRAAHIRTRHTRRLSIEATTRLASVQTRLVPLLKTCRLRNSCDRQPVLKPNTNAR